MADAVRDESWSRLQNLAVCLLQGTGLSEAQAQLCDGFVYIQQYGAGTASLNVSVAAAIVLHHFALWAGFPDRSRQGEKFDVGERPVRRVARGETILAQAGTARSPPLHLPGGCCGACLLPQVTVCKCP